MLEKFIKKARFFADKKEKEKNPEEGAPLKEPEAKKLYEKLCENVKKIKSDVHDSNDVIIREFSFGQNQSMKAALVFVDGLANTDIINKSIIEPLMYKYSFIDFGEGMYENDLDEIKRAMLSVSEVKDAVTFDDTIYAFLSGDAVLLLDGFDKALVISCRGWEKRSVSEPITESVIRGPREGFTENLRTNTALLRRKIKHPALTTEVFIMGEKTKTPVCIAYIKGLANEELIAEIKRRLRVINTDAILESGYIEQYIEDAPFSIFATTGYTEKPDVVAAKLLEGRVAIIVDGTPFVLTVPMLFLESFQTAEDYYSRPWFMTGLRFIRCTAFLISILAPAFYVSISTFHQELIPTDLLFTMVAAREGIPFPSAVEALIMILAFEILREAGVRLPRPVGQAMSIVGALVMGEAAVSAGLIGAPMVIVIAITAVSIFAVPMQADAAAILRVLLLLLSAAMGGYGIAMGLLAIMVHLASLKSYGFSYLAPLAPVEIKDIKDSIVRAPLWLMRTRPNGMAKGDSRRQADFVPATITDKKED